MKDPKLYYYSPVIFLIFIAFLETFAKLEIKTKKIVISMVLLASMIIGFRFGYLPIFGYIKSNYFKITTDKIKNFELIKTRIPKNANLLTSEFLAESFIDNPNLFLYDKYADYRKFINFIDYVLTFNQKNIVNQFMLTRADFIVDYQSADFILYKKKMKDD